MFDPRPDLMFIAHRIPYPPDKGEKIRGYYLLRHLAKSYRVHLGCLVDDPADMRHVDTLREWCTDVAAFPIDKRRQKIKALLSMRPGRPLMLDYYHNAGLHRWVRDTLARQFFEVVYVYSVAMAPYLDQLERTGVILDALDVDSEKWTAYARQARWPMRAVWSREGRTLLAYERATAMRAEHTLFVSPQERDRFVQLAPEAARRVRAIENGVDLDRFSPEIAHENPFRTPGPHLVFTGHMDYWPNAQAVQGFVTDVLPLIQSERPSATFHIVGANPGPGVSRLATAPGVIVTGRVPDPRPYLAHADICVAPLQIARGIQNKVLEAMAMGRSVVASPQAFEGVRAVPGRDLLVADGAAPTQAAISAVLAGDHPGLGEAAREAMVRGYAWPAVLQPLDALLASISARTTVGSAA